jgi:hypothetical protein
MRPLRYSINFTLKDVVSSTLDRVDWNAEPVRGDLANAVQQLKGESGKGLFVAGVKVLNTPPDSFAGRAGRGR